MGFTLNQQGACFLWSIVCGIVIAVIYDLFRLLRIFVFHDRVGVFICDFIFMVSAALASVIFSIGFSLGNTRYFTVTGEVFGFMVYRLSVGRFSVKAFEYIFKQISVIFRNTADKIIKTSKKVLQVAACLLYNIISKRLFQTCKFVCRRGSRYNENKPNKISGKE